METSGGYICELKFNKSFGQNSILSVAKERNETFYIVLVAQSKDRQVPEEDQSDLD